MADPKKPTTPKSDPKSAAWTAVLAKLRARPNLAGALARAEAMAAGTAADAGDTMSRLCDNLLGAMLELERLVAEKRTTPSGAAAKSAEIMSWLGQFGLGARKVA